MCKNNEKILKSRGWEDSGYLPDPKTSYKASETETVGIWIDRKGGRIESKVLKNIPKMYRYLV